MKSVTRSCLGLPPLETEVHPYSTYRSLNNPVTSHAGTLREAPRPCSAKLACYADTSGALVLHNPAAYAPDGFSAKLAFGADTSGALLLHNPAAYAPEGFMSMLA
jgi:hypothetical protein